MKSFTDWLNDDGYGDFFARKDVGQRIISPGVPTYPTGNYQDIVEGGYKRNTVLYACLNEISSAVSSVRLEAFDSNDNPVPNHPTVNLFNNPNQNMSSFELKELWTLFLLLGGNSFIQKVKSRRGGVVQLWPLRPDWTEVIGSSDPNNIIGGYRYNVNGVRFNMLPDEVIFWKLPDPNNNLVGLSPIVSAIREIATDIEATDFRKVTLQNRAVPPIAIETEQELKDKKLINRLTESWMQRFGKGNRGKPAFLQKGMKIVEVGMSMVDLALPELTAISESRICQALGVPPIIVGAKVGLDRSTYSNYEQARESFWDETIASHLSRFEEGINNDADLTNGSRFHFRFNLRNIPAFRSRMASDETSAKESFTSGLITRNEARKRIGMEPVDGGDVFVVSFSMIEKPIGAAPMREPMDTEPETRSKDAGPRNEKQLALLAQSLGRNRFADLFEARFEDWARAEYDIRARNVTDAVNQASKSGLGLHAKAAIRYIEKGNLPDIETKADEFMTSAEMAQVMTIVEQLRPSWERRSAESVLPLLSELITGSMSLAAEHIGVNPENFLIGNDAVIKFVQDYHFKFAREHVATSVKSVRDALELAASEGLTIEQTKRTLLKDTFDKWTTKDANRVARTEVIRSANAGARETYRQAGITKLEWLATPQDACPYCRDLDGFVIGIEENFVDPGEVFQPEGASRPLNLNYESAGIIHPPAHPNCRCTVLPVVE